MAGIEYRLDVDDGRAVDGFNWADEHTVLDDFTYSHAVKADGIRTVGRAGGKYAVKALAGVGAGMNLQRFPSRLVQPGEDDDLVSGAKTMEALGGKGMNFKPGVGRTFDALSRGVFAVLESGADEADGAEEGAGRFLGARHVNEILVQSEVCPVR